MNLESLYEQMKAPTTKNMASILEHTDRYITTIDGAFLILEICFDIIVVLVLCSIRNYFFLKKIFKLRNLF